MNRFERDIAGLQPDIIFIKIGGNDTEEDVKVSPERFEKNITNTTNTAKVFKFSVLPLFSSNALF